MTKRVELPEIRLRFSYLLAYGESLTLMRAADPKRKSLLEPDEYYELRAEYETAWKKYEKQILTGMCEVLDLEFYLPVIDVALAPYFIPKSEPMIISFYDKPDQFVDTLTHELIHQLLVDNKSRKIVLDKLRTPYGKMLADLYGEDTDPVARVHIPLHAVHKYIYIDVLKEPSRLKRDYEFVARFPAYKAAWDYVEEHGYKEIIEEFKTAFSKLK